MTRRPRILVTPWRRALPTYLGDRTILDALDPAYAGRIVEAGGLPLIASRPPEHTAAIAAELLDLADGLVVSGGGDVDPRSYGDVPANVQDAEAAADAWELELLHGARRRGLPTLAICRGAQLLAVAAGGRLGQRLPDAPGHREIQGLAAHDILAARHPVTVTPGSRLHRALAAHELEVNTIHHHVIDDPGSLEVTATAAGGVIEGVEPHDDWAAVGVQWHPEKMDDPRQRGLFAALVIEARDAAEAAATAPAPDGRAA